MVPRLMVMTLFDISCGAEHHVLHTWYFVTCFGDGRDGCICVDVALTMSHKMIFFIFLSRLCYWHSERASGFHYPPVWLALCAKSLRQHIPTSGTCHSIFFRQQLCIYQMFWEMGTIIITSASTFAAPVSSSFDLAGTGLLVHLALPTAYCVIRNRWAEYVPGTFGVGRICGVEANSLRLGRNDFSRNTSIGLETTLPCSTSWPHAKINKQQTMLVFQLTTRKNSSHAHRPSPN